MLFAEQPTTSVEIAPKLIVLLVGAVLVAAIGKALEARARTRRREARKQRQREYQLYLRSPGWKQRRQVALDRAGGFCEDCGARQNLDVHHLTYKRRGNERPEDLAALCRGCHKERHSGKRNLLDVVALALLKRWRIRRHRRAHREEGPRRPKRDEESQSLTCSNCGDRVSEVRAETAGWRYWSDGVGELLPFCPTCEHREFRYAAPASSE